MSGAKSLLDNVPDSVQLKNLLTGNLTSSYGLFGKNNKNFAKCPNGQKICVPKYIFIHVYT